MAATDPKPTFVERLHLMLNRSIILAATVWIGVIVASFMTGLSASDKIMIGANAIEFPVQVIVWLSLGAFIFFFLVSFTQRSAVPNFGAMVVVWALDSIFGENSVSPFERLLRVDLLFAVGATIYGLVGIITAYVAVLEPSSYLMALFILSAGLGLFSAFALSIKYPPTIW